MDKDNINAPPLKDDLLPTRQVSSVSSTSSNQTHASHLTHASHSSNQSLQSQHSQQSQQSQYSQQSQQSNAPSIIINKNLSGLAKQNVQTNVIDYINNNENSSIFSTNDLYHDRQTQFLTKFGKNYNPPLNTTHSSTSVSSLPNIASPASSSSSSKSSKSLHSRKSPVLHQSPALVSNRTTQVFDASPPEINENASTSGLFEHLDEADLSDSGSVVNHKTWNTLNINSSSSNIQYDSDNDDEDATFVDNYTHSTPQLNSHNHDNISSQSNPEMHPFDSNENLHGIFYGNSDDEDAHSHNDRSEDDFDDYNEYESYEDDEDDSDLLLPPSPPRSPPRQLDPDKLYGLYDFSGPDPSHCTLHRDEAVYLINDSDNYWWLIRKLTKHERIQINRKNNHQFDDDYDEDEEDYSDDEDGKVGFVPAECLETYGERLARLNCFKNEELEKPGREDIQNLNSGHNGSLHDDFGLGLDLNLPNTMSNQIQSQDSIVTLGGSFKRKDNNSSKSSVVKSVTFENLGDLILDEDEDEEEIDEAPSSPVRNHHADDDSFHNHYFDIPREDIESFMNQHHGINNDGNAANSAQSESSNSADEKRSEVLSDIFPNETPLVINKSNRNGALKSPDLSDQPNTASNGSSPKDPIRISSDSEPIITQVIDLKPKKKLVSQVASSSLPNSANHTPILSPEEQNSKQPHQLTPYPRGEAMPVHNNSDYHLDKPNNQETISIGSYSPDTPRELGTGSHKSTSSKARHIVSQDLTSPTEESEPSPASLSSSLSSGARRNHLEDESSQYRRSLILDRLNKVTFDIQEQLNMSGGDDQDHLSHYYDQENLTFGADLKHSPEQLPHSHGSIMDPVANREESDSDQPSESESEGFDHLSAKDREASRIHRHHHRHGSDDDNALSSDQHQDISSDGHDQDMSVTPLTSLNSLSNGINNSALHLANASSSKVYFTGPMHGMIPEADDDDQDDVRDAFNSPSSSYPSTFVDEHHPVEVSYPPTLVDETSATKDSDGPSAPPTTISERRKSKPVHDMFLPILGKFDDLAEKLAQLEELL